MRTRLQGEKAVMGWKSLSWVGRRAGVWRPHGPPHSERRDSNVSQDIPVQGAESPNPRATGSTVTGQPP